MGCACGASATARPRASIRQLEWSCRSLMLVECAAHQRVKHLVGDRQQIVVQDFYEDRIELRWLCAHVATVIIRLRCRSTVKQSCGNKSVVVSSCSMTAGPASRCP